MMHKLFQTRLVRQLVIAIGSSIILVELAVIFFSFALRQQQLDHFLSDIRGEIRSVISENVSSSQIESYIEMDMKRFNRNVILLAILIVITVLFVTLFVFYRLAGRHLLRLIKINRETTPDHIVHYPEANLPKNEIGDLILAREKMLSELEEYRRNIEQKLEEAKFQLMQSAKLALLGEITASIAHDLRNPLTLISYYLPQLEQSIKLGFADRKGMEEGLEKLQFAHHHTVRLVERMGEFSRIGTFSANNDLKEIVCNSLLLVEKKIQVMGGSVDLQLPPDLPLIWGNKESLEHLFANLLSNAIDAIADSEVKRIAISGTHDDNGVCLRITDSGTGIPEKDQQNIFTPFFSTKGDQGSGLGLSICLNIVEKHHGTIEVDSNIGKGTTMIVCLPGKPQSI